MGKPWEEYQKKKEAPAQEEESGPWSDYVKNVDDQKALEKGMFDEIRKDTPDAINLGIHGASLGWSDEIAGAMSSDYEGTRDARRQSIEKSREELPFMGPIIEGAGSAATTAITPGLRTGKLATELMTSAVEGLGENVKPEDRLRDVGFSVGVDLGANALGDVLKKTVSPPEEILANSMGARGINYRKGETFVGEDTAEEYADRLKDPAGLAARLDKMGFFGFGKRDFDGKKFARKVSLEEAVTPVNLETMMERVLEGVDKLANKNRQLLAGKTIPVTKVKAALDQAARDFVPAGEDYLKREVVANNLVDQAWQDLILGGHVKPGSNVVDAAAVEDVLKRKWQKKVKASYDSGKSVSDITNEGVEARRKFSTAIDDLIDSYGGPEYKANNDTMRDLLSARTLIHDKSSRLRGYSGGGARLTNGKHVMSSLFENTVFSPGMDVVRARTGQGLRTVPGQMIENTIRRTPMEYMNNQIDQTPEIPYRRPQGVPNLPEELIRTPLPRSTQGLMEKKPFVLAKVAQMAPEMLDAVQDVFENNPESIGELSQVLAMKMPHFFEKDKYNRFDGRILSEKDKAQAIKDTMLKKELGSIAQSKIITKLNETGEFEG